MTVLLQHISIFSVLLPVGAGLLKLKKLRGSAGLVWLLCTCAAVPQLISLVRGWQQIKNIAYNEYIPVEFTLTLTLLWGYLGASYKWLYGIIIVAFAGFYLWFFRQNRLDEAFAGSLVAYSNIVFTSLVLLALWEDMNQHPGVSKITQADLWFLIAILLYASVTVFSLTAWSQLHNDTPSAFVKIGRSIHDSANALLYILFAVGILWKPS